MWYALLIFAFTFPLVTGAADVAAPKDFAGLVTLVLGIIGKLVAIIFALTVIAVVWGVIKSWIIDGGSSESVDKGKKILFVGIIALVIMISVWGIVGFLKSSIF